MARFARLGFDAPCHIGPTGALRIQLGNFTSDQKRRLSEASFSKGAEVEVLKTSIHNSARSNGAFGEAHEGGGTQQREGMLGKDGPHAHLHDDAHQCGHGSAREADDVYGSKESSSSTGISGHVGAGISGIRSTLNDAGSQRGDRREGSWTDSRPSWRPLFATTSYRHRCSCAARLGGPQLHEASLEAPSPTEPPVPVLHVDPGTTVADAGPQEPGHHDQGAGAVAGKERQAEQAFDSTDPFRVRPGECIHPKTTKAGSNAFQAIEKRVVCGHILSKTMTELGRQKHIARWGPP